ncbi:MAG: class I SAM-dependent methyltransferase [Eubacteriales bacterium]|jgi:ubiquinone/menaquinone biosynthesis C-methylase UbiE
MNFSNRVLYNELKQIGFDNADKKEVREYDSRVQGLRNIKKENKEIIEALNIGKDSVILEIGSGTGELAIEAAKYCKRVYAVDISPVMLSSAHVKAKVKGISNIEFYHAGLLTCHHKGEMLDAVVSQLVLHHLPDFWKLIALKRVSSLLKDGGRLFLRDIVYPSGVEDYSLYFDALISNMKQYAGDRPARDFEAHIKDEYSTLDWIMEGLLKRAGFNIEKTQYREEYMAVYLCSKV